MILNRIQRKQYLFRKIYTVDAQIREEHKVVVFPADIELKPIRFTRTVIDYRGRRKIEFTRKLSQWDWTTVRMATSNLLPLVYNVAYNSCLTSVFPLKLSDYPR